jgi:NADH pyrophosphatase NudC (nudix superfamily)
MKAIIQAQIHCGECGSLMQYHKENTMVRCNQLKCSERHVEYLAPTIELAKPVEEKPKKAARNAK